MWIAAILRGAQHNKKRGLFAHLVFFRRLCAAEIGAQKGHDGCHYQNSMS
jgi:hypothetical protein